MGQVQSCRAERPWPAQQYDMVVDIPQIAGVKEGEREIEWRCLVGHHFKRGLLTYLKQPEASVASAPPNKADKMDCPRLQLDVTKLEDLQTAMNAMLQNRSRVISFFGRYKKGKTFVMNQLVGSVLSNGFSSKHTTLALSFLLPVRTQTSVFHSHIIIDTAGIDGPAQDVSDPKLKGHRLARDGLIKDVVVALSTDIVIVVSHLTWSDQELIKSVRDDLARYNCKGAGTKRLYVLHNFCEVTTDHQLLEKWQSVIGQHPDGEAKNRFCHTAEVQPPRDSVEWQKSFVPCLSQSDGTKHFILGNAKSDVGSTFNARTMKLLHDLLNQRGTEGIPQLTVSELTDQLDRSLKKYLRNVKDIQMQFHVVDGKTLKPPSPQTAAAAALIPSSVWEKRQVFTSTPQGYLDVFKLVIRGDNLSLIKLMTAADQVDYNQPQDVAEFIPQHDIIEKDDGFHVIIEFPDYDAEEKSTGNLTAECFHQGDQGVLRIEGTRLQLHHCANPFDDTDLELEPYQQQNKEITKSTKERKTGTFTLNVCYSSELYYVNELPEINPAAPGCVQVSIKKKQPVS